MSEQFFSQNVEAQIQQLSKLGGAFLTAKHDDSLNTMTIGWGTIGFIWGKPVFMVAVRPARHTYNILEQSLEFTVTIPKTSQFQEALALCGSKSGRDMDKFAASGLTTQPGREITTPIITGHAWQYECKVIYRQEMSDDSILLPQISERLYQPQHGPAHVLYYGEIVASYITEPFT